MNFPLFMPFESSTFTVIQCTSNNSCPVQMFSSSLTSCGRSDDLCLYNYGYADLSNTSGYLFKDKLTVGGQARNNINNQQLVFGCGIVNQGVETGFNASGFLGLSRGPLSLVSQLGMKVFSHCVPYRAGENTNVTGFLTLGKSVSQILNLTTSLQYTPMLQNPSQASYYVELTGISVNDMLLNIPTSAFSFSTDGLSGGTTVDSGTTFTTFVAEAYSVFETAFLSAMDPSLLRFDIDGPCYAFPISNQAPAQRLVAPRVTLHFKNNLDLLLSTEHAFYEFFPDFNNTAQDFLCMAYKSTDSIAGARSNIVGNFQLQNIIVEYDIQNSRIGFVAVSNCSSTTG
ncbi:hypothetical protein L7F22_002381 [Adiantum nelumboides]|nr:hypothetical protein [Adiantum nelumboides]